MINDTVKDLISKFPLGHIATVKADGNPCVSPKGTFLVLDETTIGFGNIRSPQTLANLLTNENCEINFVDPILRKGARLRGKAHIVSRGGVDFQQLFPRWFAVWGELANRITDLVIIRISAVKPLTTPPYDDGVTEEEMLATYKAKYAEIYP